MSYAIPHRHSLQHVSTFPRREIKFLADSQHPQHRIQSIATNSAVTCRNKEGICNQMLMKTQAENRGAEALIK
eukprot:2773171-Rhodomonas_salina.2